MRRVALTVVAGLGALMGCAPVGRYAWQRGADLCDCFHVAVGVGFPAAIEVRATDWLATGAGAAVALKAGCAGREWFRASEQRIGLPFLPLAMLAIEPAGDFDGDYGLQYWYTYFGKRTEFRLLSAGGPLRVTKSILVFDVTSLPRYQYHHWYHWAFLRQGAIQENWGAEHRPPIHALDLYVDATLLVSAGVGFSPGQFADFALGWFGIDLAGDDREPSGVEDGDGTTPLHEAALHDWLGQAELLLADGADPSVRDELWRTPLHRAAEGRGDAVARLLVAKGADVNARDKRGRTPLHAAVDDSNPALARLLVAEGASLEARDGRWRRPIDLKHPDGVRWSDILRSPSRP